MLLVLREWGLQNYLAIEVCEEYVSELNAQGFDCRLSEDAGDLSHDCERCSPCGHGGGLVV